MKFILPVVLLTALALDGYSQGCSGGRASYNVRERHVTRSTYAAQKSTGCVGSVALVPVTRYVAAPAAAPAKPMPVAGGPVTVQAPAFYQTSEPPLFGHGRVRSTVRTTIEAGGGFFRKVLDLILPPYRR